MAHNIEISIHSIEQAEELYGRLSKYLSGVSDKDGEVPEKKASRLYEKDRQIWDEIAGLWRFLKCEDVRDVSARTAELSKDSNRQKIQHYFISSLSKYLMENHTGLFNGNKVVLAILLKLDLMSDVIQILKLRPNSGAMMKFESSVSKEGDHWLSVHYHCIRIFSFLLNAYLARGCDEPKSRKGIIKLMEKEGGIQILLKCVESCMNSKSDTSAYIVPGVCAIVALYDMFDIAPQVFGRALTSANGIQTLGYFLYRDNALKLLSKIYQRKKLYQFEEKAMMDSPIYILPRSDFGNLEMEPGLKDMTSTKNRWAYYLRIYSMGILQMTIADDDSAKKLLMEDKLCMKAIMDWFKCPQRNQRDQLIVGCTTKLVFHLVKNREMAKLLISNYYLLKVLEAVVFFPSSPVIIRGYLEIISCLLKDGSVKDKIFEREELVFAMSNFVFSIDETLRDLALTNFQQVNRTTDEGTYKHLFKYFGPREIYDYPYTFTKTKEKWNSPLMDYKSKLSSANNKFFTDETAKAEGSQGLNRAESDRLKEKGNQLFKDGKYKSAMNAYSRAITLCPYVKINTQENGKPYLWEDLRVKILSNRAQCYLNLKMHKEALDDCNRVIGLCGHTETEETGLTMLKAFYRRAQTLYKLGYCFDTEDVMVRRF
ncbi:uncharacterized protein [Antedon mediterranea]|uniref:uncharacterized protein isoform X2 n=1 Tax=Antedon mediterranea TaxID=105859 RepID=UPI003AF924F4